jgi:hypothetical protein
VTIEFSEINPLTGRHPATEERSADSAALEGAESERVIGIFTKVLGPPGFDSSAKATVLRDTLAEFSDEQAMSIIDSLRGVPLTAGGDAAKRARHMISNVVKSGPLGSPERGGELLVEIFQRHSLVALLRLIEDVWKTQDYWLNRK